MMFSTLPLMGAAAAFFGPAIMATTSVGVVGSVLGGLGVAAGVGVVATLAKHAGRHAIKPVRGCVLKVALVGGLVAHTGVYLGGDRIAEVTEIGGAAVVREVSSKEFLRGTGFPRTGLKIYVAAAKDGEAYHALGSEAIAQRAEQGLGCRGKYSAVSNNCHMFTRSCVTGEAPTSPTWSADGIARALRDQFGVGDVSWCTADHLA